MFWVYLVCIYYIPDNIYVIYRFHSTHCSNHHHNINVQYLDKVFSCWLLGKSKRNGVVSASGPNGESNGTTAENQIFNSSANSMNHIDLEADIDLNLWHPALGQGRSVINTYFQIHLYNVYIYLLQVTAIYCDSTRPDLFHLYNFKYFDTFPNPHITIPVDNGLVESAFGIWAPHRNT